MISPGVSAAPCRESRVNIQGPENSGKVCVAEPEGLLQGKGSFSRSGGGYLGPFMREWEQMSARKQAGSLGGWWWSQRSFQGGAGEGEGEESGDGAKEGATSWVRPSEGSEGCQGSGIGRNHSEHIARGWLTTGWKQPGPSWHHLTTVKRLKKLSVFEQHQIRSSQTHYI